jgi:hypothetical protein
MQTGLMVMENIEYTLKCEHFVVLRNTDYAHLIRFSEAAFNKIWSGGGVLFAPPLQDST